MPSKQGKHFWVLVPYIFFVSGIWLQQDLKKWQSPSVCPLGDIKLSRASNLNLTGLNLKAFSQLSQTQASSQGQSSFSICKRDQEAPSVLWSKKREYLKRPKTDLREKDEYCELLNTYHQTDRQMTKHLLFSFFLVILSFYRTISSTVPVNIQYRCMFSSEVCVQTHTLTRSTFLVTDRGQVM